jgi:ABC-type Zn uptake system ZnuABC Zn-binding protein ZnuA
LLRKIISLLVICLLMACSGLPRQTATSVTDLPRILAVETFLGDITRHIVGDRLVVESLLPDNMDPHSYQPAPRDIIKVARSNVLIINGVGLETFLAPLLANAGGTRLVITSSAGLTPRTDPSGEHPKGDPHFWLDPNYVIKYVENIRDGLTQADPSGGQIYADNAATYILQLQALDGWIKDQVKQIPTDQRQLVTNHESLGYFAARYGFKVIGSIIPSLSSEAAPTAREIANLIDQIQISKAHAIFMETGSNLNLAEQISGETNAIIITDLYIHSVSDANGPAPTYIDMMKYNVTQIVNALK